MKNDGGGRHGLCGGLFGCGGNARDYMVAPDAVEKTLTSRTRDRLDRLDELSQEALAPYAASYRVSRRRLLGVGGFLGLLATLAPGSILSACSALKSRGTSATPAGRTHTVESNSETVRLGVFDATGPNVIEIDPGDTLVYPRPSEYHRFPQPPNGLDPSRRLRLGEPRRELPRYSGGRRQPRRPCDDSQGDLCAGPA